MLELAEHSRNLGQFHRFLSHEEFEGPIHLVLTDMVMPGMSGYEVWEVLAEIRPGTKVLCMSGYLGKAVLSQGMLEEGQVFLQKPFTRNSLNRKVREALDH